MHPKIEDKTVLSRFVINSFHPDKSVFSTKYKKYLDPFEDNTKAAIAICEGIVATKFYIKQRATITKLLMTTAISLRTDLDDIIVFATNAGSNLNMAVKDMGVSDVRKCISRNNMEGLALAMTVLNQNISDNNDALEDQGWTSGQWDGMKAKAEQVRLLNEKQNQMEADKELAVSENHVKFDDMWNLTLNICLAGKTLFKGNVRAKEYTINTLLKRIRHDGTTKEEKAQKLAEQLALKMGDLDFTAKDFGIDDSWIEDAELTIEGTDYVLNTDDEGGLLVDLKEGSYTAILRKATYNDVVIKFDIKAGETTEVITEMKAIDDGTPGS